MRMLVVVAVLVLGVPIVQAREFSDTEAASVAVGTGTVSVGVLALGAGIPVLEALPNALIATAIATGAYLEYTTSCASRGLEPYVGQYTAKGNRGFVEGSDGHALEERVKWEVGPTGWLQRKCQG